MGDFAGKDTTPKIVILQNIKLKPQKEVITKPSTSGINSKDFLIRRIPNVEPCEPITVLREEQNRTYQLVSTLKANEADNFTQSNSKDYLIKRIPTVEPCEPNNALREEQNKTYQPVCTLKANEGDNFTQSNSKDYLIKRIPTVEPCEPINALREEQNKTYQPVSTLKANEADNFTQSNSKDYLIKRIPTVEPCEPINALREEQNKIYQPVSTLKANEVDNFTQSIFQSTKQPMKTRSSRPKKSKTLKIFTEHTGPEWHKVSNSIVTKPIISSNLPKVFKDFPIFGKPKNNAELKSFQLKACQEFVGLPDDEFEKELDYCSPDFLLSGREMEMASLRPTQGLLSAAMALREEEHGIVAIPENPKLVTLQKLKTRIKCDIGHIFPRKLKYRGVRLLGLQNQEKAPATDFQPTDLEPGKDILFRVRVYRPFSFSLPGARQGQEGNNVRGRHSVFNCDVVVLGRQYLSELRDRIVCRNDLDLRLDMSEHPDLPPPTTSKDSFPSNFMFISNVFYVDTRQNCRDITTVVRRFAEERGLGTFPVKDMCSVTVGELQVRLAYPEVYVHQGNCEHIFQFSEIRLLNNSDPLHLSNYPCHTAVSQNQTLYCNTCAEFSARWIVTKSQRVPFDPAFFCETCFYSYMYKDGRKVEDFKAFLYKGNEINMLRPNVDLSDEPTSVVNDRVYIHF